MRRTTRLATGAAVLGAVGLTGVPVALAQTVDCSAYSAACVESAVVEDSRRTGPDSGAGVAGTVSGRSSTPSTLPFTGGEVVLLSLVGAGAVAAGTVLVVSARRRSTTA